MNHTQFLRTSKKVLKNAVFGHSWANFGHVSLISVIYSDAIAHTRKYSKILRFSLHFYGFKFEIISSQKRKSKQNLTYGTHFD